jgi:hypothetical protein
MVDGGEFLVIQVFFSFLVIQIEGTGSGKNCIYGGTGSINTESYYECIRQKLIRANRRSIVEARLRFEDRTLQNICRGSSCFKMEIQSRMNEHRTLLFASLVA